MITINHNQLARALFVLYRANVTPMIIGPSGVGKSQAVQEFARKVTDASDGHQYWQSQLSCLEAPDLMGVPFEKDGRTAYLPPENMPG
ncbi:hypothetical protein [Pararhizobium sp.]|uniref:hypothetical protein n=1 Tax=Pararhizobium sp. TaxID=1977563 RepID=UPI003D13C5E9